MRRTIQATILFAVALTLPAVASAAPDPTGYFAWLQQQARQIQQTQPIRTPTPAPRPGPAVLVPQPAPPAIQPLDRSGREQLRRIAHGNRNSRAVHPVCLPRIRPVVRAVPVTPLRR